MFFDWLACYQDFDFDLPIISQNGYIFVDLVNGDESPIRQNKVLHEGSYSTKITVHVNGRRIVMSGNPSRYNRLDNLFGFTSIDDCFAVYNHILSLFGLPPFTKGRSMGLIERIRSNGSIVFEHISDGAIITCLHITTNSFVGPGNCVDTYLKSLSMLPYRRSRGRLHADGKTVDWLSIQGNAREIYPSVYDKGYEIGLKSLPNVKRKFGVESDEFIYLSQLKNYLDQLGAIRHEQKLNYPFLKKHNLTFYGLSDYSFLEKLHLEFLNLDSKQKVSAMNLQTLTETLISENICTNTKAANITALYAINWMNGQKFDLSKRQVQVHRARLRKIGIDISKPCNLAIFSPVIVKQVVDIERRYLTPPDFYRPAVVPKFAL